MPHPINVRLPQRLLDFLDERAGDLTTRSSVIRSLIAEAADRARQQAAPAAAAEHRERLP